MSKYSRIIYLFTFMASLALSGTSLFAQYRGGNGDGKAIVAFSSSISPPIHCLGGAEDGFAWLASGGAISPGIYYNGSNGDGFALTDALSAMALPIYLAGGNDDGMAITSVASTTCTPIYCSGGIQDGSALTGFLGTTNGPVIHCQGGNQDGAGWLYAAGTISPPSYCFGGIGDGHVSQEIPAFALGLGLWNGYVNSDWNNAANWTNSSVPGSINQVTVPGNCLNYPLLNKTFSINISNWGEIRCAGLKIKPGALITTSDDVRINGPLSIEGQYQHTKSNPNSIQVYSNGKIDIISGGSLLVEP